jgi:hypothetical protein
MLTRSRVARTAAMTLAGVVATLGLASAAVAAPAANTSSAQAAAWGPNSLRPGLAWFWWTRYASKNTCDLTALGAILNGQVSGATCSARYDGLGWDLWLRN